MLPRIRSAFESSAKWKHDQVEPGGPGAWPNPYVLGFHGYSVDGAGEVESGKRGSGRALRGSFLSRGASRVPEALGAASGQPHDEAHGVAFCGQFVEAKWPTDAAPLGLPDFKSQRDQEREGLRGNGRSDAERMEKVPPHN